MKQILLLIIALIPLAFNQVFGQTNDSIEIKKTALDYIEGYYYADEARMERALHPELAKRTVFKNKKGKEVLHPLAAEKLIEYTAKKEDDSEKNGKLKTKVLIYDIFEGTATAKVETNFFPFIDYMHLAKINGEWKIVNVLWKMKPKSKKQ